MTTEDLMTATDFVALAIDPAIPFTQAIDTIAARIAELRSAPPSVTGMTAATLPARASSPAPSREGEIQMEEME